MSKSFGYDLRYAGRGLLRSPGFTAVVVLSLALGVGANTAIFSLIDQALLRPLPVKNPQELVLLSWNGAFAGKFWGSATDRDLFSHMQVRELGAENDLKLGVLRGLGGRKPTTLYISSGGATEAVPSELVTGSYFGLLGARPALGRLLGPGDDQRPGEHPVVVLSFDYWKRRLGGPADIVGRKVVVNGQSMTVVGVAERGFRGIDPLEAPSLWLPSMMQARAAPEYAGWLRGPGRQVASRGREVGARKDGGRCPAGVAIVVQGVAGGDHPARELAARGRADAAAFPRRNGGRSTGRERPSPISACCSSGRCSSCSARPGWCCCSPA